MAVRTSAIDVLIKMRGQRQFAAQTRAATAELEKMGVRGARAMGGIARAGARMQGIGSSMTRHLTVPVAAGLGYATYKAINFNKQMELIATQAGGSQKEVGRLSSQVLELAQSGKVGVTPDQMAQGLYHIESQGYRSAAAMKVLRTAVDGAEVGQADLTDTAKVLGQTMNVFGISADKSRQVMSQFNAIVGHGDMTLQDLLAALSTGVLPQAHNFQLKLEDVGGALDTMTSRTFPAARAGTALKMALTALAAPTDSTIKSLKELGIDADVLSQTLQTKGLPAALEYMKQRIDDTGLSATKVAPILSRAFGGGRTGPGVLTLIQNIGELRKNVQGARADVDSFDKKVAEWAGTPAAKLDQAKAQLEGTAIAIGQDIAPAVADLAKDLGDLVAGFEKLPAPVRSSIIGFIALAAVLGPVIWAVGTLMKGFKLLQDAILWWRGSKMRALMMTSGELSTKWFVAGVIIGVPLLAVAAFKLGEALGKALRKPVMAVVNWLKDRLRDLAHFVTDLANRVEHLMGKRTATGRELHAAGVATYHGKAISPAQLILPQTLHPKKRALGGSVMPGGTALVGERGPELAQFPFGAQVFSNDATKKMLSSQRSDPTIVIPVHLNGRVIAEEVVRAGESARARK